MGRRSTSFLRQSISMEIQRGKCASILGTVESPKLLEELFDLFDTKSQLRLFLSFRQMLSLQNKFQIQ